MAAPITLAGLTGAGGLAVAGGLPALAVTSAASPDAQFAGVSCPASTWCTAVGGTGGDNSRLLMEDLRHGRWTEGLPRAPRAASAGTASFYAVSCSAPRTCTALLRYINSGEELSWATAGRGRTGGFTSFAGATDVAPDTAAGLSCRPAACELVGGLNTNDGQGNLTGTGTPFAWRGRPGHFTAQQVPVPPADGPGAGRNRAGLPQPDPLAADAGHDLQPAAECAHVGS